MVSQFEPSYKTHFKNSLPYFPNAVLRYYGRRTLVVDSSFGQCKLLCLTSEQRKS